MYLCEALRALINNVKPLNCLRSNSYFKITDTLLENPSGD